MTKARRIFQVLTLLGLTLAAGSCSKLVYEHRGGTLSRGTFDFVKAVYYQGNDKNAETASDWVLVTSRKGYFDQPDFKDVATKIEPIAGLRAWTDDYSNLYKILNW